MECGQFTAYDIARLRSSAWTVQCDAAARVSSLLVMKFFEYEGMTWRGEMMERAEKWTYRDWMLCVLCLSVLVFAWV